MYLYRRHYAKWKWEGLYSIIRLFTLKHSGLNSVAYFGACGLNSVVYLYLGLNSITSFLSTLVYYNCRLPQITEWAMAHMPYFTEWGFFDHFTEWSSALTISWNGKKIDHSVKWVTPHLGRNMNIYLEFHKMSYFEKFHAFFVEIFNFFKIFPAWFCGKLRKKNFLDVPYYSKRFLKLFPGFSYTLIKVQ